jgi:hypothetical protein
MSTRKTAERIIATIKKAYGAPKRFVPTSESEFAHLDLETYRRFRHTMEGNGYRFLADVKILGISDSSRWMAPWMIRLMLSADGGTAVGHYQAKPRIAMWLTNFGAGLLKLRFILAPRLFLQSLRTRHYFDFESELAATYLTTSNAEEAGIFGLPSSIDAKFLPYGTSIDELRAAHEARVMRAAEGTGAGPTRMATLEDVFAMRARLQECKNAHRAALNWITRDELRAFAGGNAALGDGLFEQVQILLGQTQKPLGEHTMSNPPMQRELYERVISTTFVVLSLVLGVLSLIFFVVKLVYRILSHEAGVPSLLFLFLAVGLLGISVTIFGRTRRGRVLHWLSPGPLNYLFLLLTFVLALNTAAGSKVIEVLMISRMGIQPNLAGLLAFLPAIAGGLVFVFYWRRASAKQPRQ